jgi:asparagine synthase (glutamine-hydrolysing)
MTRALAHRGPDGEGLVSLCAAGEQCAVLGHRRLAILDLTEAGRQPMTSRQGRWTLVLNGEIFNYLELRRELEAGGTRFRSATDTEVLLEACAAWGVRRALARAVGMFAFALWDAQERELTLARDRLGEKPLVYFWDGQTLAFSSEMKALDRFHGRRLDPEAVEVYLALGYVPAPLGIFRGTRKLPAGHWLRWKQNRIEIRRWWFPEAAALEDEGSGKAGRQALRDLVAESVRLRLRADTPVALALSGGVDSTVVGAELARQGAQPDAFTVIFDGDETDLPYARQVARRYGFRHEVIRAEKPGLGVQLETAVRAYDEPFADSSAVAALALARALAGRYKVILNGDGGDEAFGGYRHYEYIEAKQMVKAVAARAGWRDGSGGRDLYIQSKTTFRRHERLRLLGGRAQSDALAGLLASDAFTGAPGPDAGGALQRALWWDRHLNLANSLNFKMDIALGSCGLEGRAPFLDHRILEWVQALKPRELVHGRQKKILLRRAYASELPREVAARSKHGFGAPVERWLRGPLAGVVRRFLPCPWFAAGLEREVSGQRLWTLLMFALWGETWGAAW